EAVMAILAQVRPRAQKRPDLIERRAPGRANLADGHLPPHRCNNPRLRDLDTNIAHRLLLPSGGGPLPVTIASDGFDIRSQSRRDRPNGFRARSYLDHVLKFLVWCVLFVLCWPLALLALIAYPIVWLLLIPFRIVGIAVDGVLGIVRGVFMLPVRLLSGSRP